MLATLWLALGKTTEVLLDIEWKAESGTVEQRSRRIRTPYGDADTCLKVERGSGKLALLMHVTHAAKVDAPERYSAPGLLLSYASEFEELAGEDSILKLTPVPSKWNRKEINDAFERGGFQVNMSGGTLVLRTQCAPGEAIQEAALIAFSLDAYARSIAAPGLWRYARELCATKSFGEEVRLLLEGQRGSSRLRQLLGQGRASVINMEIEKKLISAFARIGTQDLVQFHCRGLWLLRRIAKALHLKSAIAVSASAASATHQHRGVQFLHGSLQEPPDGLPSAASALLVDALPPWDDLRLERAADALFKFIGFEWVLCLEQRSGLEQWGQLIRNAFGYAVSSVWKIGEHEAILFRRKAESIEKAKFIRPVPDLASMKVSSLQWSRTVQAVSSLTIDPRWVIYLPPSIATLQSDNSTEELEPPQKVLDYYLVQGISKVIVEAKPFATRAIAIVCRDETVGRDRFGVSSGGSLYTRKGRPFLPQGSPLLRELRDGLSRAEFWKRFDTDWACIEGDVLPWSSSRPSEDKQKEMLRRGESLYAAAADAFLKLRCQNTMSIVNGQKCLAQYRVELEKRAAQKSGPVAFAPVHLIATEGKSYFHQTHLWHMQTLSALSRKIGEPFVETPYQFLSLDEGSTLKNCTQFRDLVCAAGGDGIVLKPLPFVAKGHRGLAQPAFLCRGRESLRLAYGPEYDLPGHRLKLNERETLKHRRDTSRAILRQLALSMKAVEHFVKRDATHLVEECIRGVLALEESH